MSGLVLELQRDALNNNIEITTLLRKAFVISKKLGITDVEEWLNQELNGYFICENDLPEYREIHGILKAHNRVRGLIPFHIKDPELSKMLSSRKISQSIGELESLLHTNNEGSFCLSFPPDIRDDLMQGMELAMEPILKVAHNQVYGILDCLRNEILNWALELEAKGVKGEGMTFSNDEKKVAESVVYKITNNIGSMQNSQLQQASDNSTQSFEFSIKNEDIAQFLEMLRASVDSLKLQPDDKEELKADISTIDNQLSSPKPKKVIIFESLKSVRNIIEGTTGSLVATGLLAQLGAIITSVS